jgi:hypothetical protein
MNILLRWRLCVQYTEQVLTTRDCILPRLQCEISQPYVEHFLVYIKKSLNCDKSVPTQNLAFLSYWYRKKSLQMHY